MIGLPVFLDQDSNMAELQRLGAGRLIRWPDFTEEKLKNTIQDILTNAA